MSWCVKSFVPELWSNDQLLVHLASGEIASKSMVIDFKTAKKRGEDARKEFCSRFTRVNSLVTTKWTYYDSISKQPCKSQNFLSRKSRLFVSKKSAKKKLVIPTDEGQSFAETLSEFTGKTLELKLVMHGRVTKKPWSIVNEKDKAWSKAKSIFRSCFSKIQRFAHQTMYQLT